MAHHLLVAVVLEDPVVMELRHREHLEQLILEPAVAAVVEMDLGQDLIKGVMEVQELLL
jgi:hypothetical protein